MFVYTWDINIGNHISMVGLQQINRSMGVTDTVDVKLPYNSHVYMY